MIDKTKATIKPKTQTTVKPDKPLTRKQKAFVKHLVDNPKASATAAAKATYDNPTEATAQQIAFDNLRKPNIVSELAKYEGTAEGTLVEVMKTSKDYSKLGNTAGANYASTAANIANSIIDRIRGKATQRTESVNTTVTLSLSLKDITSTDTQE